MFRFASSRSATFARSLGNATRKTFATALERRAGNVSTSTLRNLAIGGAVGVASIAAINLVSDSVTKSSDDSFSDPVQRRLRGTYGYLAGSLATTAVAARAIFQSGLAARMMTMNPIVLGIGSLVGMIGTMYLTRSISYHESPVAKHLALGSFIGFQALMMAPLAALGGPLLLRAAVATGAIVGSVSLTAATAPSQTYLKMGGVLSIGCGLLMGASLGSMFFPGVPLLYQFVLYGGLAIHGGMIFFRTQNLIDGASRAPRNALFDPINDSIGIYIDSLAIFWRMVMIMQGGGNSRRRN